MKMNGALVTTFLLLTVTWTTGSSASSDDDQPEPLPVPIALTQEDIPSSSYEENLVRRKRDLSSDLLEAAGSLGVGGSYIKKFNALINGVPPNVKEAFIEQDFSNVSESDIRNLNISVLEFIPPNVISKMNITYLNPVIERLLQANKPMALGRVMQAMGDKMDSGQLLDKIKQTGGMNDQNEEAASVLLYTALNKVGDKGGISQNMIRRLTNDGLLSLVPEEQLMKVTDPGAAKQLLNRLYKQAGDTTDLDDVDDRSLIYKLAETGYGEAKDWSGDTIRGIGPKIMSFMPADFLKNLSPDAITNSISTLKDTKFETPLQAKSVADVYLESNGISNQDNGEQTPSGGLNLNSIISNLGPLAAFMNPGISKDGNFLTSIVNACSKLSLPAPLKAVAELLKQKTSDRGKKIDDLGYDDLKEMGVSLMKSGPPQLIDQAMKKRALSENDLNEISSGTSKAEQGGGLGGIFSGALFQGIIAQVSQYAVQYFTRGGKINFGGLPGAFLGALGIKGMNDMSTRDLDDAVDKLKNNPDSLDDAQKALLLKKLRDAGMMDTVDLPPEIRNLQPRKKGDDANYDNILDGLPSDAELRLAHGQGKRITASELERDKNLVGTLTPSQVNQINLEDIPAVLAVVRKSKDGPQAQTLEALSKRFAEYVRSKSEDYDSPDKKLLKYMSAAEVSKLPATVLAYFIDHRQTSKLPPDVRKEIMIAMGELSTKDHAAIPGKTRNEIILQGLDALDKMTGGGSKKIDVPELAAIGQGVSDLPADEIEKLTPVALESAIQVIQGTSDDDDDGLKQRACLQPDQRRAWRKKIIATYGDPASWDAATVSSLCCTLGILEEGDLRTIAPDALVTCQCISDAKPPSHLSELKKSLDANCKHELGDEAFEQPKKVVEKVKSELAFDLDDLESQIISRRRRRNVDSLNCFKVRLTGSGSAFSKEQLETLAEGELHNCIYELGADPLPVENARVIWKKLLASKNNQVKAEDIHYAGYILSGITINDVNELDLADPDIVLAFGKPLGLSKNVLEKLAMRLEQVKDKPVTQFDSEDLVVANNILCGFSSEQLTEIDPDLFRESLPVLKNLDPSCEQTRLAALAAVAVKPEAFGDPKNWTAADVRGIGTILNGLPLSLVNTIPAESFLGVTPTVAGAMPETVLKELNAEQIANIPRFSAQAMSAEQVDAIDSDARDTLLSIIKGPISSSGFSIQPQSQAFFFTATTLLILRTAISYNVL